MSINELHPKVHVLAVQLADRFPHLSLASGLLSAAEQSKGSWVPGCRRRAAIAAGRTPPDKSRQAEAAKTRQVEQKSCEV